VEAAVFEPLRVLVVDDEDGSRLRVVQSLTSPEVQVDAASTGPEALLRAQACGDAYHVAVISQIAGTLAAIEIMQRLREVSPALEFILLTDLNDVEPTQRAIEQGAYRCLGKPVVNIEQLRTCVQEAARLGMERRVLDRLVRAGQRISSAQTEEDLWSRLHAEARKLIPGLSTFIVSDWDELNQTATWPYCVERGRPKPLPPRSGPPFGITEYVIQTREPLLLPQGDEAFRQEHELAPSHLAPSQAEIVAPMFLGDKVVGTLSALTYDPTIRYTYNDLRVLQTLANQAAVAAQSVRHRREMAKLCAAAVELAGQRESVAVQREIVKEAHNLIQPDFTGLVLQSEDGRLYRASPVVPEESSALFGEPRQDGVSRHVVDTGRLYIQEDAQADPNVSDSMKSLDIQSILAVPLSYKGKVLGMLWFNSLRKRQFSDHDVNLCTTFAAQAAAALWSISTEEREFSEIQRKLLAGMTQVCRGFRQWQDTQVLVDTIAHEL